MQKRPRTGDDFSEASCEIEEVTVAVPTFCSHISTHRNEKLILHLEKDKFDERSRLVVDYVTSQACICGDLRVEKLRKECIYPMRAVRPHTFFSADGNNNPWSECMGLVLNKAAWWAPLQSLMELGPLHVDGWRGGIGQMVDGYAQDIYCDWSPSTHRMFPRTIRRAILLVLLMASRADSCFSILPRDVVLLICAHIGNNVRFCAPVGRNLF